MDNELLADRIMQVYPELKIVKYEKNNFGQNNDVLIINDQLVFRFPKYDDGIRNLEREVSLLKIVEGKITAAIPSPIYTSLDIKQAGKVFAGYRLLEGKPMWKRDLKGVPHRGLKKLASQLVSFLINLHSIPIAALHPVIQQDEKNPLSEIKILLARLQNKVYPYMSNSSKETVSFAFESFFEKEKSRDIKTTLIHGDFGASNILWKVEKIEISGIIDFGASGLGDPAYDFAGLLSSYGEEFFEQCIRLYPGGEEIKERVMFYKSTFALQEALHGIENNDEQAFKNGIKAYL
ncbi:aminoglycoside phosphotransferase family protein [Bacillus sp. JJ1122]|uniref:phosphotransferase family protein n=1 Tax=Bacillus sp. JJ1122 TaxID=3122951 RepID=UPI00300062BC